MRLRLRTPRKFSWLSRNLFKVNFSFMEDVFESQRNKDEFANGAGQKLRAINEADSGCKCWLKSDFFFHSFLTFTIYHWSWWKFTDNWYITLNYFIVAQNPSKARWVVQHLQVFLEFYTEKNLHYSKAYLSHTQIQRTLLSFSPLPFSLAYCIAIICLISVGLLQWGLS